MLSAVAFDVQVSTYSTLRYLNLFKNCVVYCQLDTPEQNTLFKPSQKIDFHFKCFLIVEYGI